jgi:hypothetical protein
MHHYQHSTAVKFFTHNAHPKCVVPGAIWSKPPRQVHLPPGLSAAGSLVVLKASNNQLSQLPDRLVQGWRSLKELDVSHNQLKVRYPLTLQLLGDTHGCMQEHRCLHVFSTSSHFGTLYMGHGPCDQQTWWLHMLGASD